MARFVCRYHKYSACGIQQPEDFSATFTMVNSFVYFSVDEQQANWTFAQFGRTQTGKVRWFSPIYGKQLACDCGQSMCHAEPYELIRELVISGATAVWTMHNLSTDSDFYVESHH